LIVNDFVLIERKAAEKIAEDHAAQLLNYLKATNIEVGLVLNFGPTAEFRRKVYDNERKGTLPGSRQSSSVKFGNFRLFPEIRVLQRYS